MRVLVTETQPEAASPVARQLVAAGHEVVRCREEGAPAFPCAGLQPEGCPVEAGIDVALTVRTGPPAQPTAREDGAVCALRRHVPLVVAGPPGPNPFEGWATTVCHDEREVVAACEQAASADVAALSSVALGEARRSLAERGHDVDDVKVSTTRSAHQLKIDVAMPDAVSDREADAVAVAVADVVRAVEPTIAVIDVRRS